MVDIKMGDVPNYCEVTASEKIAAVDLLPLYTFTFESSINSPYSLGVIRSKTDPPFSVQSQKVAIDCSEAGGWSIYSGGYSYSGKKRRGDFT